MTNEINLITNATKSFVNNFIDVGLSFARSSVKSSLYAS